jgi:hypothetical protein
MEFQLPNRPISPFFGHVPRIPRKLKKKMKKFMGCHWHGATNGERLWYCMDDRYRWFLIMAICKQ